MNEEFNNTVDNTAETTDTPVATLNGEELISDAQAETIKKTNYLAILIIILCAAFIMTIVYFIVRKTVSHDDSRVASVSTELTSVETSVSEPAVSENEASTEEPVNEPFGTTVASSDFSAMLTEDGYIKDADLTKVADIGLVGLEIPYASVAYIDDKVDADLLSAAEQYAFYSDDATLTVQNGNTINLNYSGSIDGVVFDGGTADYQTLTIGSGSFIDNFEEQLIGAHPGDDVDVTVTFPDPYQNNPDLAGKEAVFACHVNSIYTIPEVDDAFVQAYYSDIADNVEDLKAYIKEQGYLSNIDTYLANYVTENASVSEISDSYLSYLKSLLRYSHEQSFAEYQTYMMYYGYSDAATMTFADYVGISAEEYEKFLD